MKFILPYVTFTRLFWDLTVWKYQFGGDASFLGAGTVTDPFSKPGKAELRIEAHLKNLQPGNNVTKDTTLCDELLELNY